MGSSPVSLLVVFLEKERTMSSELEQEAGQEPQGRPQASQQVTVQVKDEDAIALYANFCRVTGSPEELIVDFGLNPQLWMED